ncbi:putative carbonic anhydrase 3 [Amphibalanus amphitrite]|uniref:carbonic anhydrase n=1 Tax=Amphibalanus amphitrite TaxID=1232801 RepID=A0A6A4WPS5_AMPAM|nr:putative carbonic anhydrase 3 [Amphibalanus amphitrite]
MGSRQVGDWKGLALRSLESALQNITAGGAATAVTRPPRLARLLPWNTGEFFRYRGSLTTPGCHQAVTWTVFTQTLRVSASQMSLFRSLRGGPAPIGANYRPPQRRYGRTVLLSTESGTSSHQHPHQHQEEEYRLAAVRGRSAAAPPCSPLIAVVVAQLVAIVNGGRWGS